MNGSSEPLDAYRLVAALSGHEVDFVVIGGVALQAHGHVRTTVDLDVVAAWTPENMRHLADALDQLGAKLRGVDADRLGLDLSDPETLYAGGNFLMHTRHGDLDVFSVEQTAGAPARYEELRIRAITVEVRGITLLIAHPDDLIRMKTAAAQFRDRPAPKRRQDLDDIAVLQRLRASQEPEARQTRKASPEPPTGPGPARSESSSHQPPRRDGPSGPSQF
ncbi:MAG: DUF6036 family nucleotidyltransferase [Solirubrobacteraceae bacterium]